MVSVQDLTEKQRERERDYSSHELPRPHAISRNEMKEPRRGPEGLRG
jgi:hypothetical protein